MSHRAVTVARQGKTAALAPMSRLESLEPRQLLSTVWQISGDQTPGAPNDVIVVQVSPDDATLLQAIVNGELVEERAIDSVKSIRVSGGAGDDVIRVLREGGPAIRVIALGGAGNDTIETGAGDDLLYGGSGDDTLRGGEGNDFITGQGGLDKLYGEAGDDRLVGGRDADRLTAGEGSNDLNGGSGVDWIFGRPGFDFLRRARHDTTVQQADRLSSDATPEELKQWFIDWTVAEWESLLGQKTSPYNPWWDGPILMRNQLVDVGGGMLLALGALNDSNGGAEQLPGQDYSGTNNQVQGVDEADIVKTDGQTIYTLVNGELVAISAVSADEPSVLSRTAIDGYAESMYLFGNRLTVISTVGGGWGGWYDIVLPVDPIEPGEPQVTPVEIGVADAAVSTARMIAPPFREWQPPQTQVTVYDVSDPANPTVVEESSVDGWLVSSRAIDGRVILVMQNNIPLPPPEIVADEEGGYRYESAEAFRQRLIDSFDSLDLPGFTATDGEGNEIEGSLFSDLSTYLPDQPPGRNLISLVELNMLDDEAGPVGGASTVGLSGQVYASTESIYLASESWLPADGDDSWGSATFLYRFDLNADGLPLVAEGAVPGSVINQFAMDEYDGRFRIATTEWRNTGRENNLFVLEQDDDLLNPVGAITGLAKGEQLYSARFMGEQAYLVTFRTIDPLFVIDLSDPYDPQVAGELKIPGFSNYLHPVGDGFLLGLGRDADPETGQTGGLQLSLFDVRDPQNPVRSDVLSLGDNEQWAWSTAIWDHHAFSFFAQDGGAGVLALPVSAWLDGQSITQLEVISVTTGDQPALELLGAIDHDSPVNRSLRIGGNLFSLSDSSLKVNELTDPANELAELRLVEVPGSES